MGDRFGWGNITWGLGREDSSSICSKHGLIQCKVVHRTYFTNARLSKIYKYVSSNCDRCHQAPADLIHLLWVCPSLFNFWTMIFNTLSEILGRKLDPNPFSALFGVSASLPSLSLSQKNVIALTTLLARRLILMKWKSPAPLSHTHWIWNVLYFLKLEKIRLSLQGRSNVFVKVWGPFHKYIKKFSDIPT